MRQFLTNVPLFLPAVVLSVAVAMVLASGVARWLSTRPSIAFFGLVSFGVIIAATLTPGSEALMSGVASSGGCDMSRVGIIPLSDLTRVSEPSLNILLFVPLGIALGLLPWTRRSMAVVAIAVLLPLAIELIQAVATDLGRGCESADVVDNLTGLLVGLVVGGSAGAIGRTRRARPR